VALEEPQPRAEETADLDRLITLEERVERLERELARLRASVTGEGIAGAHPNP
jgi:hypothetical protein